MGIPKQARALMEQGHTIPLATVSSDGTPNVAPMLQYWWYGEATLVIGDLFMHATRKNVEDTGKVSFSVWDPETGESYKFNGTATYETSGAAYDMANDKLHTKKPEKDFKGVVVIKVTEVYDAARTPNAGKLIASL